MGLADKIESQINSFMVGDWTIRNGQKIPDTLDLGLTASEGVEIPATFLYADLAESSNFGQNLANQDAAKIIKSFLYACSAIIKDHGGEVKSFDGDRVMGVFFGPLKEERAVRAAFNIHWEVVNVISDKASRWIEWPSGVQTVRHATGIATGTALMIRGGVRADNDLAAIGSAPNVADKLSEIRGLQERTFIDQSTWNLAFGDTWHAPDGTDLWTSHKVLTIADKYHFVYGSYTQREPRN